MTCYGNKKASCVMRNRLVNKKKKASKEPRDRAANPQSGSVPCRSQATICGIEVERQWGRGPNQILERGRLISVFAGSQALIQGADGKLCVREGGIGGEAEGNFQRGRCENH